MKISPGCLKQIFVKNQKCLTKNLNKLFCFRGFHLQYAFDDNLCVTHVFIKQIFRAVELAPPSPSPSQGCAGGGVVMALFSHKQ
jgi:hypothetical protein